MSKDSSPPPPPDADTPSGTPSDSPSETPTTFDRRDFLRLSTAGAGLFALGARKPDIEIAPAVIPESSAAVHTFAKADVVVVGAGLWGSFTAYNLRKRGAKVTLVDQYGAGNSRATSGDETRGVRSSYGDREAGELWMLWARDAMVRWRRFDEEFGKDLKFKVFHTTGDMTARTDDSDPIIKRTREWWDKHKVPYQVLPVDEVRKRWPVIDMKDMGYAFYEPDAGVLRARRAAQYAAVITEKLGGRIVIGKAKTLRTANGKLEEIELDTGEKLRADLFVFALGPWMRTFFPSLLGDRMRTPLGYVCYFATPPGDERFTYPNLPSYNFTGVTGWPALPLDSRGFRVRGGRAAPAPAATTADAAGATGAGANGARGSAAAVAGAAGTAGAAGAARGAGAAGDSAGRGAARGGGGRGGGGGGRGAGGGGGGGGGGGRGDANAPQDPALTDPDLSSRWTDEARIESSRRFLQERFPILGNAPISETRACHYEGSINRDFIIDWHPDMSNVLLAGAGNSEGAKFAPVIGDYVAQRALGIVGDPEIAKRFIVPKDTYASVAAAAAAKAKADSITKADSIAKGRGGRGGDEED